MDSVESATSLTDHAREWIGGKLVRVGSLLMPQRAQSDHHLSLPAGQENRRRRASETVAYDVDSSYYNRLKEYSLRAFGGQKYNEKLESYDINEEKAVHSHNSSEGFGRNKMTEPAQSFSISISLTTTEGVPNPCIRQKTRRHSDVLKTEIGRRTSAENGNKYGSLNILQPIPGVSNVSLDFEETFDEQHTSGMSEIMCRENVNMPKMPLQQTTAEKDNPAKICIHENKETKSETDETFSKKEICEKLRNIPNKTNTLSSNKCKEKPQSSSCSVETNEAKDKMALCMLPGKCKLKVRGEITLALQHFKKSHQLRVVLLSVESSTKHNRNMFCKVKLTGNSLSQKQRTRQLKSTTGNADFKETFYMDLEKDDMKENVLKVQLRTVSRFFQRHSTVGVAYIALENIDLTFDTTMSVKLRDPKQSRQVSNEEDMEIVSDNRFIDVKVTKLVQDLDHPKTRYSSKSRRQSLPHIHNNGGFSDTRKRAMTLEDTVRSTANQQKS